MLNIRMLKHLFFPLLSFRLIHFLIDKKVLISVAPRSGTYTIRNCIEQLQKNGVICVKLNFYNYIVHLPYIIRATRIKYIRNPLKRTISMYTLFCTNKRLRLWEAYGINESAIQ